MGPHIRQLVQDEYLIGHLNHIGKAAGEIFKDVCQNFLDIHKSDNYKEVMGDLLKSFKITECNISIKKTLIAIVLQIAYTIAQCRSFQLMLKWLAANMVSGSPGYL